MVCITCIGRYLRVLVCIVCIDLYFMLWYASVLKDVPALTGIIS